jgi:hypothetical protein
MRQKTTLSCSQILERAGLPILERSRKLSRLEQAVLQCLPAELGSHCNVVNLKNEILVLSTPSPAWAARLRFAVPDLVKQLKCQFSLEINRVVLKTQPEKKEIQPVKRPGMRLSLANATLLAQTAQSIRHPALQEALYRLAAKTREI